MFNECVTDPILTGFLVCFFTPFIIFMWGGLIWIVYQAIKDHFGG